MIDKRDGILKTIEDLKVVESEDGLEGELLEMAQEERKEYENELEIIQHKIGMIPYDELSSPSK